MKRAAVIAGWCVVVLVVCAVAAVPDVLFGLRLHDEYGGRVGLTRFVFPAAVALSFGLAAGVGIEWALASARSVARRSVARRLPAIFRLVLAGLVVMIAIMIGYGSYDLAGFELLVLLGFWWWYRKVRSAGVERV